MVVGIRKKIVIIGSGPGGYTAAVLLSKEGHNVTIVEKNLVGGTCLNVGCIPTKSLLDNLSLYEQFTGSVKKNIFNASDVSVSLDGLRNYQSSVISQLSKGLDALFKKNNIKFIEGTASIKDKNTVLVDGSEIEADEIIIATGSSPKTIPTFELNSKSVVSSDDVWSIPKIPEKILIVGSGPIGIEFARVFNTLGSKVTISEILPSICPILDKEISENVERSLKRRKVSLKKGYASKCVNVSENEVTVEFFNTAKEEKQEEKFNQVLIATGRTPNTNNLGLQGIGVELEQGFVVVNDLLKTTVDNIWAIGDITKFPQLAHTASAQARIVAENICGKNKEFKGDLIPSAIYGYPEVAFVGKNEEELKRENIEYSVGKFLFLASGKAKASSHTEGLAKVLIDKKSKQFLGAHIIGAEASNLIHEIVIAMNNNIPADKFIDCIHAHPTYSEVLYEAVEDALGVAVHV